MTLTWDGPDRPRPPRVAVYTRREWVRAFLRGDNPPPVYVDAEPWRHAPPAPPAARPAPTRCERSTPFYNRYGIRDWTDECGQPLPCPDHSERAAS